MARRGLVVWLACLVTGCPSDPAEHDECQGEPDFFLSISSESGVLPRDLQLSVEYGGGAETFTLAPGSKPEVVFCEKITSSAGEGGATGSPGEATAGDSGAFSAGAGPASLACRLWTEGPAAIELSAAGYTTIERDLRVDAEQCTTSVDLELSVKLNPAP